MGARHPQESDPERRLPQGVAEPWEGLAGLSLLISFLADGAGSRAAGGSDSGIGRVKLS